MPATTTTTTTTNANEATKASESCACVLLGYYAASSDNILPTFRDSLSVLSSRVNNYHFLLRNDPEDRSSHLLRGESLNSRTLQLVLLSCRMLTVASSKMSDSSNVSWLRTTVCVPADSSTVSYQQFQQGRGLYFKSSVGSQNQIQKQKRGAQREVKPSTAFLLYWPWYCCRFRARPCRWTHSQSADCCLCRQPVSAVGCLAAVLYGWRWFVPQESSLRKFWSKLFDYMQQSPSWAPDSFTTIQEAPTLYGVPKLDRVQWSFPGPDLSRPRPPMLLLQGVHCPAIHTRVLQSGLFVFPNQHPMRIDLFPIHATYSAHLILFVWSPE